MRIIQNIRFIQRDRLTPILVAPEGAGQREISDRLRRLGLCSGIILVHQSGLRGRNTGHRSRILLRPAGRSRRLHSRGRHLGFRRDWTLGAQCRGGVRRGMARRVSVRLRQRRRDRFGLRHHRCRCRRRCGGRYVGGGYDHGTNE